MNERKLKAKCVERGVSADMLASAIGISVSTYYRKLGNKSFAVADVIKIAKCLGLSTEDITNIFYEDIVA